MELLIVLAAVLVGTVAFGVVFGGAVFAILKFAKAQNARFAALAGPLGLEYAQIHAAQGTPARTVRGALVGVHGGLAVDVYHVSEGSKENRATYTYVTAALEPPLRLGLTVTSQNAVTKFFGDAFGAQDVPIGDARFDAAFRVRTDEPAQTAAVLAGRVATECLAVSASYVLVVLTDETVRFQIRGYVLDAGRLRAALDDAARLGRAALEARRAAPPAPWEAEVLRVWEPFARARGFAFDRAQTTLEGSVGRTPVRVVPVRSPGGWRTRVTARLAQAVDVDLRVVPEGALSGVEKLFGMQDIALGDARFDGRFVVQGSQPERVRALLDQGVRDRLFDLSQRAASVRLERGELTVAVPGLIADGAVLGRAIDRIGEAADALSARAAPPASVYR